MVKSHRNRADSFRGPLAAGRQSGNYFTPDTRVTELAAIFFKDAA